MGKDICKNISQNLVVNIARNFWITLNKLQQMHLKQIKKEQFKKQ